MVKRWLDFISPVTDLKANKNNALEFVQYLFSLNLEPKTVKAIQNNIKSVYNRYILKIDENFKNPFARMPIIKTNSRSLKYFNDNQILRLKNHLQKTNPKLWLACQLQYYCFIRPNELRQLKAENFNLLAGYIEVLGSISKNKKTQKVSIPNGLMENLLFIDNLKFDAYIFESKNEPVKRDYLSKDHKKALNEHNILGRYGFYSWKHTGVVKAVKAGIHIKDLQLQLRHHSLDMVNEYLKNLGVMDMERIKDLFPAI